MWGAQVGDPVGDHHVGPAVEPGTCSNRPLAELVNLDFRARGTQASCPAAVLKLSWAVKATVRFLRRAISLRGRHPGRIDHRAVQSPRSATTIVKSCLECLGLVKIQVLV